MNYRFSQGAKNVLETAQKLSIKSKVTYVGTEQILGAILSFDCVANKILYKNGLTINNYLSLYKDVLDLTYDKDGFTPRVKNMLENANNFAIQTNGGYIATEHLLLAIIYDRDNVAVKIMEKLGVSIVGVLQNLGSELGFNIDINSFLNMQPAGATSNPTSQNPSSNIQQRNQPQNPSFGAGKAQGEEVSKFGIDLTKLAKESKLDPVIGREKEIDRIIQILSRRTKNNPVLIGEPGVGKSAVIEGFAQKIVKGEVPELLRDKVVFSLDIAGMLAGAKYRGDFEERFKDFIESVKTNGNVIIFIDEIHNIMGAGSTSESKMDIAEMLKPMLARGELQTIGATTIDEYRKYIEKDAALERRFQPVQIDQPSVKDAIEILKGIRDKYEAHHKVVISDEAIVAAATLSDRYITDRFLPDKAIDLIDEAASRARLDTYTAPVDFKELNEQIDALEVQKNYHIRKEEYEKVPEIRDKIRKITEEIAEKKNSWDNERSKSQPRIGEEEVAKIVSSWTGVPVVKLTQSEAEKLLNLEGQLHGRVIGQEQAVEAVSRAIRRARAGLKDPKRPIGSFIFVGPTGVGKTELSKALAEAIFGDENLMIRIDMSEYMEKHSVSKLVGAPPGYVGFEDSGGQLTEKVRRKPYSVLLFDEIEKAHPDVFNILLQILDDGRLTDSKGRVVDFKNTIIIMTSNAGAGEIQKIKKLGFTETSSDLEHEKTKDKIMTALKSEFKPEFLNRVDDIIVFKQLDKVETAKIADLMLLSLAKRLAERNINIVISDKAKEYITSIGYDSEYGARPLRRTIQRTIEDKLSEEILSSTINFGDKISVDFEGGVLTFVKI